MPAFRVPVSGGMEDGEEVVFFASLEASIEALDGEVDTNEIEPIPEFDKFESLGKVPLEALSIAGWYHYCDWCERRSDDEEWEECDEEDPSECRPPVKDVFRDPFYFCCDECSESFDKQSAKLRADRDAFVAEVHDRWDGLTLGFASGGVDYDLYVSATFEGGKADIYKRVLTGKLEVWSAQGTAFNRLNPKA